MRQEKKPRRWPWIVTTIVLALALLTLLGWGFYSKYQAEHDLPTPVNEPPTEQETLYEQSVPPVIDADTDGEEAAAPIVCALDGFIDPAGGGITEAHTLLMAEFMDAWYRPLAEFGRPDFTDLFTKEEDSDAHADALRTLIAIRQGALTDLRMLSVDYTLTVTDVEDVDGFLRVEADETAVMRFAATPETDSVLASMPHIFIFDDRGEQLTLYHHEADDNPYFSFTYDESGSDYDAEFDRILRAIERRQLLRGEKSTVTFEADHPYDREAACNYTAQYWDTRNDRWYAYDEHGGNCMNFASQVLLAGGIPMDSRGDQEWYWYSTGNLALSWVNVGSFYDYARKNEEYGLVADTEANYYTGEVGDILIVGFNGSHNHATIITDIVYNEAGEAVDYLLSCNTTNYRDFPAGAYYYTFHRLVKIHGWNELE